MAKGIAEHVVELVVEIYRETGKEVGRIKLPPRAVMELDAELTGTYNHEANDVTLYTDAGPVVVSPIEEG